MAMPPPHPILQLTDPDGVMPIVRNPFLTSAIDSKTLLDLYVNAHNYAVTSDTPPGMCRAWSRVADKIEDILLARLPSSSTRSELNTTLAAALSESQAEATQEAWRRAAKPDDVHDGDECPKCHRASLYRCNDDRMRCEKNCSYVGPKVHVLKTNSNHYRSIECGSKRAELRKNDRDFQEGDILELQEWVARYHYLSGKSLKRYVSHVLTHNDAVGLQDGYVILSILPMTDGESPLPKPLR